MPVRNRSALAMQKNVDLFPLASSAVIGIGQYSFATGKYNLLRWFKL